MRKRRGVLVVTAALLLYGVTAGRAEAALHPGDRIDVTVYNHPELSGVRTLDALGNVSVPVAGTVPAANLETQDVAELIRARLATYVRMVSVQVRLDAQSDSIFVAGGPGGTIKYQPGETLSSVVDRLQMPHAAPQAADRTTGTSTVVRQTDAVDLVNGPVDFHRVSIMRDRQVLGPYDLLELRGIGQTGPALAPNDTIQLVNKPVAVTIAGGVQHPGVAYLRQGEPLALALEQLGGAATTSSESGIVLDRAGTTTRVSLGSDDFAKPAQNGDHLFIPRAPHVDVVGNVTRPGETILRGSPTLVSAIYYAGGPSQYANLKAVQVIHDGSKNTYNLDALRKGRAGENPTLADGDVVLVPQGSTFDLNQVWSALGTLGLFGVRIR